MVNNFLIGNFRITPFLACSREPLLVFYCVVNKFPKINFTNPFL